MGRQQVTPLVHHSDSNLNEAQLKLFLTLPGPGALASLRRRLPLAEVLALASPRRAQTDAVAAPCLALSFSP